MWSMPAWSFVRNTQLYCDLPALLVYYDLCRFFSKHKSLPCFRISNWNITSSSTSNLLWIMILSTFRVEKLVDIFSLDILIKLEKNMQESLKFSRKIFPQKMIRFRLIDWQKVRGTHICHTWCMSYISYSFNN